MRTSIIGFALGMIAASLLTRAMAAPHYAEDQFVRMIERHLSASANMSIGPGVTVTSPECNCTIRYLGTRVNGNHYHVDIDKLD